jgi:nitrite reductase (NADH) small subunit/3-phenylpropionate/trans-cinnamate dioxygenase ferredoxin subunit
MSEFIKVANKSDLPSGQGTVVEINGRPIALFNVNGEFYALDNVCPHRGGPVGEGYVDCNNLTVQCPWHGWTFSLASGVSPVNSMAKVEKFDVVVEGDEVKVSLE